MTTTSRVNVTRDDIRTLRAERAQAGDEEGVALCDRALDGDASAWCECEQTIAECAAQG